MEKKENKNKGIFKFFETLILIALIGYAVMIVFEVFFDQLNGDYDTYEDYEYYDYSDDSYEYFDDYYSDLDYYETYENTTSSNFVSIEDFMNSETGKEFLKEPPQNLVNSNENSAKNITANEEEDIVNEVTSNEENTYNYYDEQNAMKAKFEKQKKNIEIKDEGKSSTNEIMISIKNNNEDFVYDVTLNTIFFKDNQIVSIDVQDINIIDGNNTKYIKVSEVPEDYDNYEFLISKRNYTEYYNELLNGDVSISSNDNRGYVEISIHNKSNKKINRAHFTILYFDESGKLIDFYSLQDYSIKAKKTQKTQAYGVWDEENDKYLDYADYEVILDYAENYGY